MNGLSDDICDILVDAIVRTRIAQVYLAGNGISQVCTQHHPSPHLLAASLFLCVLCSPPHILSIISPNHPILTGRGGKSQVPSGALARPRRHAVQSAADPPGYIPGIQVWPNFASACSCSCSTGCGSPSVAAAASVNSH
jgi:hypothetical protein